MPHIRMHPGRKGEWQVLPARKGFWLSIGPEPRLETFAQACAHARSTYGAGAR